MKALIIAAHGSRKPESNSEVVELAVKLSRKAGSFFDIIEYAFLQFAQPLLENKIQDLAAKGVKQIIIFPLFIAAGSHVIKDIPKIVEKAEKDYSQMDIKISTHLGKIKAIDEIILKEVMRD
jgi:sirohydrochlorin ferrochelatase